MASIIYKWSIDEWHELVDTGVLEGKPVELLEGNIVMRWSASPAELSNPHSGLSPEGIEHSYTSQSVSDYLRNLFKGKTHIRDAHPITLDNSEPEPDIAVVQLPTTIYRQHHPFPENIYLLIEISNRSLNKDLEEKTITYARNGIPEYWVIDLKNKKLIFHTQPQNNTYLQIVEHRSGAISLRTGRMPCPSSSTTGNALHCVLRYAPQAFTDINIDLNKLLLY
jgi:hypothetical protein